MIYVTVGNHCQGFDRLIRAADGLAQGLGEPSFAQIGHSSFIPVRMEWTRFEPYAAAIDHIKNASCVISHAGIGTIINAKNFGVPIVIVPRKKSLGEHFNDHQAEMAEKLTKENRPRVFVAEPLDVLESCVRRAMEKRAVPEGDDFQGRAAIVSLIKDFVASLSSSEK
jgi:UDP-N-acetylglucosamine transferase subunit ALG13